MEEDIGRTGTSIVLGITKDKQPDRHKVDEPFGNMEHDWNTRPKKKILTKEDNGKQEKIEGGRHRQSDNVASDEESETWTKDSKVTLTAKKESMNTRRKPT